MSTSCFSERLSLVRLMQGDWNEVKATPQTADWNEVKATAPAADWNEVEATPPPAEPLPAEASPRSELIVSYFEDVVPEASSRESFSYNSREVTSYHCSSCIDDSYKQEIRPQLDVIDRLRSMDINKEGIELPTIVVVGDQSSGKSSVLESLAGIKLPRGDGICTRVPLVMRLKSCKDESQASISIDYSGKDRGPERIEESEITEKIKYATKVIAGDGYGISDTPITLEVVREGAPDLTMVDLPGITRVAIAGQPPDIHEEICEIIMRYIKPEASIILNVISADVDFSTCESIKLSKLVDERGERTLAVVTKCDRTPDGLRERVTMNAVGIRLGFVCVVNGVGNETYENARKKEKVLFDSHPKLKHIEKSMVGIPVLATKLMQIQGRSINKSLPTVIKKIASMLSERQTELTNLPQHLCSPGEANVLFYKRLKSMEESLNKILIEGDFKEFEDDRQMHCTARLWDMFEGYYTDLRNTGSMSEKFLAKETEMLDEAKGVGLSNFLSRPVFKNLLRSLVDEIAERSLELVVKVWEYMEIVILRVIDCYCKFHPRLHAEARRVVEDLVVKKKNACEEYVTETIEMEKLMDSTLSPSYIEEYGRLLTHKTNFIDRLSYASRSGFTTVELDGIDVDVSEILDFPADRVKQAYDMQMSLMAYWRVVTLRMGDGIPLRLQFACKKLGMTEFTSEILTQVGGPGFDSMEQIMEESPEVANKRSGLTSSIGMLTESKKAVESILDRTAKV